MRSRPARAAGLLAAALVALVAASGVVAAPASAASSHAEIDGTGSSWSYNAITQWIADVTPNGLKVVYTGSGSAIGRKDFANRTTDFGVSEIGYQGVDPVSQTLDTSQGRAFAYLPIVAGGTSFPYNLKIGTKRVVNLRLSGTTLTKIFTNQITRWNDPAIKADNNGRVFPNLPIIVVVHSEGSGSTAQLTKYFNKQYPSIWNPFLGHNTYTEYFPRKGQQIAQNGSDQVMNFITSSAANGSIGYDEYSYALNAGYPVAKIENAAGYYNLPTQYNVAVALQRAQINEDKTSQNYLLQNLDNVYTFGDIRTYPLSSYSYMLIPTASSDARMTTAKRQTLADFLYYSVCDGQKEMGPIGYSPLPVNLVQGAFEQVNKLKTADRAVDITARNVTTCNNPTFDGKNLSRNRLAEIAPNPPLCDKSGQGPCTGAGDSGTGKPSTGGSTGGTGNGNGTSSTGATTAAKPSTKATASKSAAAVDPATGQSDGTGQADGSSDQAGADAVPVDLAAYRSNGLGSVLGPLAVILLLLVLILPPILVRRLNDPKAQP